MWKLLVMTAIVINLGEAQRSSYAPRPGSNSKLLPRYRKNETDTTSLGTRGGQEDSAPISTTTLPPELQGTLEDHKFVHRVSQWPEDRQPFWFKNRYAISSMRDQNIDGGNVDQPKNIENERPRPTFQSPFKGSGRGGGRGSDVAQFAPREAFYDEDFIKDPFYFYQQRRLYY